MPAITKPAARIVAREHEGGDSPVIRSDRVRRQIADQIISGALRPGQELDEKKLAEAFNVSRTPVREALRQLAAASFVDWRPHQSAIVAKITPSKMVEMFEVMAELEGFCGRLAARRMTASEHAYSDFHRSQFRPYVQTRDREGYHALNKTFHDAIYAGRTISTSEPRPVRSTIGSRHTERTVSSDRTVRLASQEHQAIIHRNSRRRRRYRV